MPVAAIPAIVAVAVAASSVAATGLAVYQAVRQPSASTVAAAVGAGLQLPASLAGFAKALQFPEVVSEAAAPAIEVSEALSKVLGEGFGAGFKALAQILTPLRVLDPRFREVSQSILGMAGKSLPDIASVLSLSLGKPRRRFKDIPLLQLTGLDEDVQPLGEVVAESSQQSAEQVAGSIGMTKEALDELTGAVDGAGATIGFPLIDIIRQRGLSVSSVLEAIQGDIKAGFDTLNAVPKYLREQAGEGVAGQVAELLRVVVSGVISLVAGLVFEAVEVAHRPIADGLEPRVEEFFRTYRDAIRPAGEMRPEDAPEAAARAFGEALKFGVTAHMLAVVAELAHPLKHLGFPQLAAGLVDAAAFGPIMSNTIGRSISVGLGRATEWQARREFRTVWPGLREATEMMLERRISPEQLAERLRYEGWPEWWIEAYLPVPFKEPPPRELAIVYEDVEVDEAWVLTMLKQQGYADEDAERLLTGIRLRTQKSLRAGLISEVLGAYEDGLLQEQDLRDRLAPLNMRDENIRLLLDRANLGLSRNQAKALLGVYRKKAEEGIMPVEEFRVLLRSLGFVDSEVEMQAGRVDAERGVRRFREEVAEGEREIRKLQELAAKLEEERVRRGLSTPADLEARLLALGYEAQTAQMLATLALVRQDPILRLPTALTKEAQAQKTREILAEEILARVRNEVLDPGLAGLQLLGLGLTVDEIKARVDLELARITKPPEAQEPPKEPAPIREARRIRTQEAQDRFQAGELDEAGLRAALLSFGHPAGLVEVMVSREATERRLRDQRSRQTERSRTLAELNTLQRDLILDAVRTGQGDPADAILALQAIGLTKAEATLRVTQAIRPEAS